MEINTHLKKYHMVVKNHDSFAVSTKLMLKNMLFRVSSILKDILIKVSAPLIVVIYICIPHFRSLFLYL